MYYIGLTPERKDNGHPIIIIGITLSATTQLWCFDWWRKSQPLLLFLCEKIKCWKFQICSNLFVARKWDKVRVKKESKLYNAESDLQCIFYDMTLAKVLRSLQLWTKEKSWSITRSSLRGVLSMCSPWSLDRKGVIAVVVKENDDNLWTG